MYVLISITVLSEVGFSAYADETRQTFRCTSKNYKHDQFNQVCLGRFSVSI